MRLKDIDGSVFEIFKACPVVENRIDFNKKIKRLIEYAREGVKPNAILFEKKRVNSGLAFDNNIEILVGNLSACTVEEILNSLNKNGYADISNLNYQEPMPSVYNYKFDNGNSEAYHVKGCNIFNDFFDCDCHNYNNDCEVDDSDDNVFIDLEQ